MSAFSTKARSLILRPGFLLAALAALAFAVVIYKRAFDARPETAAPDSDMIGICAKICATGFQCALKIHGEKARAYEMLFNVSCSSSCTKQYAFVGKCTQQLEQGCEAFVSCLSGQFVLTR